MQRLKNEGTMTFYMLWPFGVRVTIYSCTTWDTIADSQEDCTGYTTLESCNMCCRVHGLLQILDYANNLKFLVESLDKNP